MRASTMIRRDFFTGNLNSSALLETDSKPAKAQGARETMKMMPIPGRKSGEYWGSSAAAMSAPGRKKAAKKAKMTPTISRMAITIWAAEAVPLPRRQSAPHSSTLSRESRISPI